MRTFSLATFAVLLAVALGQSPSEICAPPQFTADVHFGVSGYSFTQYDYERGLFFLGDKEDKFGDRWMLVDREANRVYTQEEGEGCVFVQYGADMKNMMAYDQCLPEDAELIGNTQGLDMYKITRGNLYWVVVLEPIPDSQYYVWVQIYYGDETTISEFMISNSQELSIEEPSLLEKDVSACVEVDVPAN